MRYDIPFSTLEGQPASLADYRGSALLIVNVASECGSTPQYAGLQKLHEHYAARGFSVLGFPCNQFGEQEPGTASQIREFCSARYAVTFPMFEKIEVNGPGRHALYGELTQTPDATGKAGDVAWNFEKFLVGKDGSIQRFRTSVEPDDPKLVAAIERAVNGAS
jgi:glutathione peroxidase